MDFKAYLELLGCSVEVTQEDDGSGYTCLDITTPTGLRFDVTVTT